MLMRPATAAVATQTPRYQFPRSGVDTNTIAGSMELMGTRISYPRNVEIFGEGESAEYLYKVVSGSVRSCKILDDGRRQITGFYIVGEVFGLEHDEEHHLSAEAVNDTVILVVKRSAITGLAARDADIAR
jgi:CRP/FNR family transcriptional regulator, nitrogen fixation regulation protein